MMHRHFLFLFHATRSPMGLIFSHALPRDPAAAPWMNAFFHAKKVTAYAVTFSVSKE